MPRVVRLSHYPPGDVPVGKPFQLLVELDEAASGPAAFDVKLEKQRITVADGGFLQLRPTGGNYFAIDPKPIPVADGSKFGISSAIAVKPDAIDIDTGKPVEFPDSLIFTAFMGELSVPFTYHIVMIAPVSPLLSLSQRK
jgi:hypothetical protein